MFIRLLLVCAMLALFVAFPALAQDAAAPTDPKWLVIVLMAIPILASALNAVFKSNNAFMRIIGALALAVGKAKVDPKLQ